MRKLLCSLLAVVFLLVIATPSEAARFKDVKESHSLQLEIEYLAAQKIISGYEDNTFKPNNKIVKKHIASMLVKALELPTTNLENPGYKDVPMSHPYYKEIAAAYTAGIFGKAEYFKPESTISRAFMAKILVNAFDLEGTDEEIDFVDVKKSSSYYTPIQIVASNNITQGSKDQNYNYYFEPNKTLTRAHFSAFLARAMTLMTGNYKPDRAYNYYYLTHEGTVTVGQYTYEEDGVDYWDMYDLDTGELLYPYVYLISNAKWVQGIAQSDAGYFATYPFTIGVKFDALGENSPDGRLRILDTNATVTIEGTIYRNVVVIEQAYGSKSDFTTIRVYVAEDYGIVGIQNDFGGSSYHWTYKLLYRE